MSQESLPCGDRAVRGPRSPGILGSARARLKGLWQPACPEPLLQAPPQVLDSLHPEVTDSACPKPTGCGQQVPIVSTSTRGSECNGDISPTTQRCSNRRPRQEVDVFVWLNEFECQ